MSYTKINGMRSTRYPLQAVGSVHRAGTPVTDYGLRRQLWRTPGMFGLGTHEPGEPVTDYGLRRQLWRSPGMFGLGRYRPGMPTTDYGFRKQLWRSPGMFGTGNCAPCGAIEPDSSEDEEGMTTTQSVGTFLAVTGALGLALYLLGS